MSDINDKWTIRVHGSGIEDLYAESVIVPRVGELVRVDANVLGSYRQVIMIIHDYVNRIVHVGTSQY